tara:strand:- start:376 stop:585 length:210 start_codon:yes stop_codon:yes gene_type:complete
MASPKVRKRKRLRRMRNLGLTNKSVETKPEEPVVVVEEKVEEKPKPAKPAKPAKKTTTKKKALWSKKGE